MMIISCRTFLSIPSKLNFKNPPVENEYYGQHIRNDLEKNVDEFLENYQIYIFSFYDNNDNV